jgi:hypothetical protein
MDERTLREKDERDFRGVTGYFPDNISEISEGIPGSG